MALRASASFATEYAFGLESLAVLHDFTLLFQMRKAFHKKTSRAAGGIKHGFAQFGVAHFDHESDDSARRVELTRIHSGIAHFLEHGLVEMAKRVNLLAGSEMDAVKLVDRDSQRLFVSLRIIFWKKRICKIKQDSG